METNSHGLKKMCGAVELLAAIDVYISLNEGSWKDKRRYIETVADKCGCMEKLSEFVNWFNETANETYNK